MFMKIHEKQGFFEKKEIKIFLLASEPVF